MELSSKEATIGVAISTTMAESGTGSDVAGLVYQSTVVSDVGLYADATGMSNKIFTETELRQVNSIQFDNIFAFKMKSDDLHV